MDLFVYGTLKRGFSNHHLLAEAEFLGEDFAPGALYGGGVPVVAPAPDAWVKGEVFRVTSPEQLSRLDRLEGHPRAYRRTPVRLRSGRQAEIYYWPHPVAPEDRIESGEWTGNVSRHRMRAE